MKALWKTLIFPTIALLCISCPEDPDDNTDPNIPETYDPISLDMDIGPYGGELELSDESGNTVKVTFPPSALSDTVSFTLTLLGEMKDIPMETRVIRPFTLEPEDLNLYVPAIISVEYSRAKADIEEAAIFRIHKDDRLAPLAGHEYQKDGKVMSATTLKGGEFAEGDMSIDQLKTQRDLLFSSLGITWKSAASDCYLFKEGWDYWEQEIGSILQIFDQLLKKGHYENLKPGENTLAEDMQALCNNVVSQAVDDILKLPVPEDPCCREYSLSIYHMLDKLMAVGCTGNNFDRVYDRSNEILVGCETSMTFQSTLEVSSGGFIIETQGEVPVIIMPSGDGNATVAGSGSLTVTGMATAQGPCSSKISGTTTVEISGTRDAAHFYYLTIKSNQDATMVTTCPDYGRTDPLKSSASQDVVLSRYNNFFIYTVEPVDEGSFTSLITLLNPYADLSGQ